MLVAHLQRENTSMAPREAVSLLPARSLAKRKSFHSHPDVMAPFPTIYEIKSISCIKLKRFKECGFHL